MQKQEFFLKIRHLGIRTNFTGQDGSIFIYSFKILSQAKPIIALRPNNFPTYLKQNNKKFPTFNCVIKITYFKFLKKKVKSLAF